MSLLPAYAGLRIVVSDLCLEETDERTFPASKNRSARIHKKLAKRFGGEFRKVPCIWRMGGQIVMHPTMKAKLDQHLAKEDQAHDAAR